MKKLKLDLDSLDVASFEIPATAATRGTVQGHLLTLTIPLIVYTISGGFEGGTGGFGGGGSGSGW